MLNYKTCLKLKEAGFPLRKVDDYTPTLFIKMVIRLNGQWYFIPTLSELIEECGDELLGLIPQHHSKKEMKLVKKIFDEKFNWVARGQIRNYLGMTPEIAVAKLYLALKSK